MPEAYLALPGTCTVPASCTEKKPEPHSTEAQAARARARDSLGAGLLHNQQRKRGKTPEIAASEALPTTLGPPLAGRPAPPPTTPTPFP